MPGRVRIAVVGSANVDLTIRVPRLPAPGETVAGADLVRDVGGKGANQAVAAARLGADAALVGAVGNDAFGADLRAGLGAAGVDVSQLSVVPDVPTGVALIQVRPDGENTITLSPGANGRLTPAAVAAAGALLADAGAVVLQLEVPLDVVVAAARAAAGLVVLNAAPLPPDPSVLADLLRLVDVLVVNEHEALGLAAGLLPAPDGGAAADWPATARRLRTLGPDAVVVTLGVQGAVAAGPGTDVVVPAYPVDVVDAVGAGDACCAGLALGLAARLPLDAAVRLACAAGAVATTGPGAQGATLDAGSVGALLGEALPTAF